VDSELSGPPPAGPDAEAFDHQVYVSVLEEVEAELSDVEHALRRLDEGSYGVCETCGRSIDPERLAQTPAARFCAEHGRRAELPRLF
jgi:RNA polymerase-binding transcription factor DksA